MGYNAWDLFRRIPCRGDYGRRAAVDVVVCFGCEGISCFFLFFFSSNAHGVLQVSTRLPCLIYLSTSTGVRTGCYCTGCHYLISLSVCLCMCNIRRFY